MAKYKITERKITDYLPDSSNANEGSVRGLAMLEDSLSQDGAGRSIVADAHDRIPAGNKTMEAAVNTGIDDVIEIETDGNAIIVHKRRDWDLADPQGAARRYAYRDNRSSEVSLTWNVEQILADLNAGVDLSQFFREDELQELLDGLVDEPAQDPGAQIDKAAELQAVWQVKRGNLWAIGKHLLLCGDSTNAEDVARVMAGERFRMIWTDPPYGVDYADIEDSRMRSGRPNNRASSHIVGDKLNADGVQALVCDALRLSADHAMSAAGLYLAAPPGQLYMRFAIALIEAGYSYRRQLVWLKNHMVLGRGDYHYKHEPIIYGWLDDGTAHYFTEDRTQVSVFQVDKPNDSDEHPTMKPIELIAQHIRNSSKPSELVYEPFAGSGSTGIACEQLGRVCRMIEIAPEYCSVILDRMQRSGIEPRRVE